MRPVRAIWNGDDAARAAVGVVWAGHGVLNAAEPTRAVASRKDTAARVDDIRTGWPDTATKRHQADAKRQQIVKLVKRSVGYVGYVGFGKRKRSLLNTRSGAVALRVRPEGGSSARSERVKVLITSDIAQLLFI